jgi:hypothetical protein
MRDRKPSDRGKPRWKLQSIFSLVRSSAAAAAGWAFSGCSPSVAVVLALMCEAAYLHNESRSAGRGTLLTTPYLFMYDMVVLAIPLAFLVRVGLKTGFRSHELPALGCALALIGCYMFTGTPTGFGATLIVSSLILARAGSWWRREPAPSLVAARA